MGGCAIFYATSVEMCSGINLGCAVRCVFLNLPDEYFRTRPTASDDGELSREGAVDRRTKTANTFTIPQGALLEWVPPDPDAPPDGLASVQWQREDYLNCDRV
jgi:hypothetical protein